MKTTILVLSLTIFLHIYSDAQTFEWAASFGSSVQDETWCITVDGAGNSYTTGNFRNTVDFDPSMDGVSEITAAGSGSDVFVQKLNAVGEFVCKLNAMGQFVWANRTGGTANDFSLNLVTDAANNIYDTGYFWGDVDFDPGTGTTTLENWGAFDIYVRKSDPSGNMLWARSFGSTGCDIGYDVALDNAGNVFCTGRFEYTADFDPGSGTQNLVSNGEMDTYLLKMNNNGEYLWARGFGSTMPDWAQGIDTDANGDVYVAGFFNSTADFDAGVGTSVLNSNGGEDLAICKYDANGNFVWAHSTGGSDPSFGDRATAIAVDAEANVYTAGNFYDTADFDFGASEWQLTSTGSFDMFMFKLSQPGIISVYETEPENEVFVFPNPGCGSFRIAPNLLSQSVQLTVTDATGRNVYTENITDFANAVHCFSASGYYIIQLEMKDGSVKNMRWLNE